MNSFLLFLFSNNFFSGANYFSLLMLMFEIFHKGHFSLKKIKNYSFYILILASLSYMLMSINNGYVLSISSYYMKFILPIILFYIGYLRGFRGYRCWKKDVLIIMFASFIHGFLNMLFNRNINILLIAGRQYRDIYGGTISATLQNLMFILSSSLFFYFLICEKNKKIKISGIFLGVAGAYCSVVSASRTMLVLMLLMFLISLFIYLSLKHNVIFSIIYMGSIIFFLLIISGMVVSFNLFGIKGWFEGTALAQRMLNSSSQNGITENLRWKYSWDILKMLIDYPFGNIPYSHYAHNLWLDVARDAGIVPFVLYILFIILCLKEVFLFCLKNKLYKEKIIFIVSVSISYVIVFFTEPIMEGTPITFSIFCFLIGGIISLSKRLRKNYKNKI